MLAKRLGYLGLNTDLNSAKQFEVFAQDYVRGREDFREAVSAFGEKRKPKFTGQ